MLNLESIFSLHYEHCLEHVVYLPLQRKHAYKGLHTGSKARKDGKMTYRERYMTGQWITFWSKSGGIL